MYLRTFLQLSSFILQLEKVDVSCYVTAFLGLKSQIIWIQKPKPQHNFHLLKNFPWVLSYTDPVVSLSHILVYYVFCLSPSVSLRLASSPPHLQSCQLSLQVLDITQYLECNFLMTFKADQVENKLCSAQLSVSLGFLTFQPEIRAFLMT